jgi:hypothetical protein
LPTDLIAHAGFDMELATCPAGDSNRAQSLIRKALSKAQVEMSSLDHEEQHRRAGGARGRVESKDDEDEASPTRRRRGLSDGAHALRRR